MIIDAVLGYVKETDDQLTEQKTLELYQSERNAGETDYYLTALLPGSCSKGTMSSNSGYQYESAFSYFCVSVFILVFLMCLCCTRVDNKYCSFCSKNYVPVY